MKALRGARPHGWQKHTRFALVHCPHCKALYQVVKVEAPEAEDQQISCRSCHKILTGREWRYVIKYFHLRDASNRRKKGPG